MQNKLAVSRHELRRTTTANKATLLNKGLGSLREREG